MNHLKYILAGMFVTAVGFVFAALISPYLYVSTVAWIYKTQIQDDQIRESRRTKK